MDVKLPERTARELEWHDGVTVWVKTLNLWQRDEAWEAADIWAHWQVRQYRSGEAGCMALSERFGAVSPSDRALYLAESGLRDGSFAALAVERFPDPERPSDPSHRDAWEIARATAVARREAVLREMYDSALLAASGNRVSESVPRCCVEFVARRLRELRGFRVVCETLQRAVRVRGEHLFAFFADSGEVADLSDAERDYLWSAYAGMQLDPEQVPTSAAVSRA